MSISGPPIIGSWESRERIARPWRVAAGAIVLAGLGVVLLEWARATEPLIRLPVTRSPALGGFALMTGIGMILGGALRRAASLRHWGFAVACAGLFIATGSASGLWLVMPVTLAVTLVLAIGEHRRAGLPAGLATGGSPPARPWWRLRIAPANDATPILQDRLAFFPLVFIPWLLLYKMVTLIGAPPDAVISSMPFERAWPVWVWTEPIYASPYLLVTIAPLVVATNRALRRFAVMGLITTAIGVLLFLIAPLIAPPRPMEVHSWLEKIMDWERWLDETDGTASFPSFHVIWTMLGVMALESRWPRWRWPFRAWGLAVAASCVTTGMHSLVDLPAGVGVFLMAHGMAGLEGRARAFGEFLRKTQGLSAGAMAFTAMLVAGVFAGPRQWWELLIVALFAWAGSALFGFSGEGRWLSRGAIRGAGALGGAWVGAWVVGLLGGDPWRAAATAAVVTPWALAVGRLLGGESIPGLREAGRPIDHRAHYGLIAIEVAVGLAMLRLAALHTPMSVMAGIGLILVGLGRWIVRRAMEEGATGHLVGDLIWAVLVVAPGAWMTCAHAGPPDTAHRPTLPLLALAMAAGCAAWLMWGYSRRLMAAYARTRAA